ncbi:hypothetical protein IV203_012808 [Nitzschia inconspicua]|uniref:Uncharacterized protein n=1 Tax=Nitzschia inconspicua TaxID=303405 RepID=A0A9K3M4Q6_9STRA|nr:hypothetical protein IV203_012808 [Nitzschia inconspicua]
MVCSSDRSKSGPPRCDVDSSESTTLVSSWAAAGRSVEQDNSSSHLDGGINRLLSEQEGIMWEGHRGSSSSTLLAPLATVFPPFHPLNGDLPPYPSVVDILSAAIDIVHSDFVCDDGQKDQLYEDYATKERMQ